HRFGEHANALNLHRLREPEGSQASRRRCDVFPSLLLSVTRSLRFPVFVLVFTHCLTKSYGQVVELVKRGADRLAGAADGEKNAVAWFNVAGLDSFVDGEEMAV